MTCIIVEDQPPAQRILQQFIGDVDHLELIGIFPDALQTLDFLRDHRVDLMFLDIHLPKLSGMDFLKSLTDPPRVILTTAFPNFALESYEFNVVDYLLKPFSFARFVRAVSRVQSTPAPDTSTPPDHLFVKSGYEHIRVTVADIRYIRSDADYTELHLSTGKILSTEPLRYWQETLADRRFVQTHRSYLINLDHLQRISSARAHLTDKTVVPIGRAYKEGVMRHLE